MHVVVVGAGAIGLSIAASLAERGHAVTVFEQEAPGAGTTSTSYAWVNSNNKQPDSYYRLNLAGVTAHKDLARAVDGDWLVPHGHLEFATDSAHAKELTARADRLAALGYDLERVDPARARALVPGLIVPDTAQLAVRFAAEAHCFPLPYVAFQLDRLRRHGGELRTGCTVNNIGGDTSGPTVALSDGTTVAADQVVLAVGRWTGTLLAASGVSLSMSEYTHPGDLTVGYLCTTTPTPATLNCLVTSPELNLRPDGGGRLRLQALDLDITAEPSASPAPDSELSKQFLNRLRAVLQDTEDTQVERIVVGRRAIPGDGLTVAGPLAAKPGVYVVATHSGITLAPYLGDSVANELLGQPDPMLDDFRPDRLIDVVDIPTPKAPRRPGEQ